METIRACGDTIQTAYAQDDLQTRVVTGSNRVYNRLVSGSIFIALETLTGGLSNQLKPAVETFSGTLEQAHQLPRSPDYAIRSIKFPPQAGKRFTGELTNVAEQAHSPALWVSGTHLQAVYKFMERR